MLISGYPHGLFEDASDEQDLGEYDYSFNADPAYTAPGTSAWVEPPSTFAAAQLLASRLLEFYEAVGWFYDQSGFHTGQNLAPWYTSTCPGVASAGDEPLVGLCLYTNRRSVLQHIIAYNKKQLDAGRPDLLAGVAAASAALLDPTEYPYRGDAFRVSTVNIELAADALYEWHTKTKDWPASWWKTARDNARLVFGNYFFYGPTTTYDWLTLGRAYRAVAGMLRELCRDTALSNEERVKLVGTSGSDDGGELLAYAAHLDDVIAAGVPEIESKDFAVYTHKQLALAAADLHHAWEEVRALPPVVDAPPAEPVPDPREPNPRQMEIPVDPPTVTEVPIITGSRTRTVEVLLIGLGIAAVGGFAAWAGFRYYARRRSSRKLRRIYAEG